MKILLVSDDFLPNPGGIAAHVYELSRALAAMGHRVDLIAGHNRLHAGKPYSAPEGVRLIHNHPFAWSWPGYIGNSFRTWRAIAASRTGAGPREADGGPAPYDVVHWHNLIWETWGVRFGAGGLPRVFTNHSSGFLRRMGVPWRRRWQLPLLLGTADRILCPSTELQEKTIEAGYPAGRTAFIANGVDVGAFSPGPPDPELAARYGLGRGDRVLVVPRRFDPKNGVDVLVRALPALRERHPRVKVLLVGDGERRAELEGLARGLDVIRHLVFCGSQPRHLMAPHLRLAEAMALPSRKEAVSLAGLEAMACGLPVVGSRVGGIPEFVSDPENGRLVPPDDPPALASALADLLDLPGESLKAMGERARASVAARFSWSAAAARTVEEYRKAVAARKRGKG